MVQDIIIRAEFLIEDLNKSILKGEGFHPHRDVYGELYREFVVPMIDNQK
jgi:hypothetical protein